MRWAITSVKTSASHLHTRVVVKVSMIIKLIVTVLKWLVIALFATMMMLVVWIDITILSISFKWLLLPILCLLVFKFIIIVIKDEEILWLAKLAKLLLHLAVVKVLAGKAANQ